MYPAVMCSDRRPRVRNWAGLMMATVLLQPLSGAGHEGEHPGRPTAARSSATDWTRAPLIEPGRPGEDGRVRFRVIGFEGGVIEVFGPDADASPAQARREADGSWSAGQVTEGHHHLLRGTVREGQRVLTAATWWFFPKPGPSPEIMLKQHRGGLELLPDRLPNRGPYKEGERRLFSVYFDGVPLAGVVVVLETARGSRIRALTDTQGEVAIRFPDDLDPQEIAQGGRRTSAGFVVSTTHRSGDLEHVSAFNGQYGPDPMRNRSLGYGVGFMVLGMVAALPLLRNRRREHG